MGSNYFFAMSLRLPFGLLLMMLTLCGSVLAQNADAYATVNQPTAVSLPGSEASLMMLDDNLWVSSAGLLWRAECYQDAVLAMEADTVMNGLGDNVVYAVRHPFTGNLFYLLCDRRGRYSLYELVPRANKAPKQVRVKLGRVKYGVTHPVFSTDGSLMVFSARLPEGAGMDIWYSRQEEDGWSEPVRMGGAVNTIGDEVSPFIWGDYLLFASRGRNGESVTSWQVYAVHLSVPSTVDSSSFSMPIGEDSEVQLLPLVVNSGLGDLEMVVDTLHQVMYWITLRDGMPALCAAKGLPEGFVLTGQVFGVNNKPISDARLDVWSEGRCFTSVVTNQQGQYSVPVQAGRDYTLHVSAPNCFSDSIPLIFYHNHDKMLQPIKRDVALRQWDVDSSFRIDNVFGDNADVIFCPKAERLLASVRQFLKDNPQLRVVLTFHGSCTDDDYVNALINERRLSALCEYFSDENYRVRLYSTDDMSYESENGKPLYDWLEVLFQKK